MSTTVIIEADCPRCLTSGWLERVPGDQPHQLPIAWHQKQALSPTPIPKPRWFRQDSLRAGRGERPQPSHPYRETLDCFDCKGKGKIPKEAELYEE